MGTEARIGQERARLCRKEIACINHYFGRILDTLCDGKAMHREGSLGCI